MNEFLANHIAIVNPDDTIEQVFHLERIDMKKSFECSCGWVFHRLRLELDGGMLFISVVNAPADYSLLERIKGALHVLAGKEHSESEIVLYNNIEDFKQFVASIPPHNGGYILTDAEAKAIVAAFEGKRVCKGKLRKR